MIYRLAGPNDSPLLNAMLRDNPMQGWVNLCLTREPVYFAASALYGDSHSVIAETREGEPVGMYACSSCDLYINGAVQPVLYLHSLRVNSRYRRKLSVLRGGFASIPRLIPGFDRAVCGITSLADDNAPARRLLEAGLAGLPCYQPCGELVTLVLPASRGRDHGVLRWATTADIPALVAFYHVQLSHRQFAPVVSEYWLHHLSSRQGLSISDFLLYEQGGVIAAALALWDQRFCKQVVVRGYRAPLDRLRPLYNLWAGTTQRVKLPAPGQLLPQIFLAFAALGGLDPVQLNRCLDEALYHVRTRGADCAVLGLSPDSTNVDRIVPRYRPEMYRTQIEMVTFTGQEAVALDAGNVVWPEAALL